MATDDRWPFPIAVCPRCGQGFGERTTLVIHQLERRHWKAIPPPDPVGAAKLRAAVEAAEVRRRAMTPVRGDATMPTGRTCPYQCPNCGTLHRAEVEHREADEVCRLFCRRCGAECAFEG
jgi:hypothetical protein